MAETDVTDATPSQEALSVTGAAQQLLDRFPETPSDTKPDPKPVETEDTEPAAEVVETEDTDSVGLEEEPDETPKAPPLHKVQVDGVEQEITLEEALRGYSRTADYSKKTMQLAENRRTLEADTQAARQARDAYAEKLTLVDQALADEPTPDWAKVRQETPEDFPQLHADWQIRNDEHQKVKAERKRVTDEQATEAAQRQGVYLDQQAELLRERIPDFSDATKVAAIKSRLVDGVAFYDVTPAEMAATSRAGLVHMAHDALEYRKIIARKADTPKQTTTPTAAPGARPPSAKGSKQKKIKKEAQDRLARTGRLDDAVEALLHMDD